MAVRLLPQYKALDNDKRYTVVTGGRGSAKSFHVSAFLAFLTYTPNEVILFTRWTMASAHISIIPEFVEKLEEMEVSQAFHVTEDEIINKLTGSRIIFRGIKTSAGNQTANLKSIAGLTCWVLDEAEELPSKEIFDKIDLSIRKKGAKNRVILVLNPSHKQHWIYKKWFRVAQDDTQYIHTTYLDNLQNLSPSFISTATKAKDESEEEYSNVFLGQWRDAAQGLVYKKWSIGQFKEGLQKVAYGLDFGFTDKTALVEVALEHDTIFARVHIYSSSLTASDLLPLMHAKARKGTAIYADHRKEIIEEIRRAGFNILQAEKGAGSIDAGIETVNRYKLVIDPASVDLIEEIEVYAYDNNQRPVDGFDHALDALRYAVTGLVRKPNAHAVGVSMPTPKRIK